MTISAFSDELAQVRTKKKEFLTQIERIVPWKEWLCLIQPCYYKGERGNKPYPLETMLRLYLLQNLYDLSDEATVAEVIDSRAFSDFCGIDSSNQVPDGDTLGRFRNLLLKNGLQEKLFSQVVAALMERGLILKKGTIVDSTIISAPSSTKNKEKKRDPDAHQVKKGNTWHFGYKAHIGVDRDSGLVHTVEATAANVHDATETSKLLTGDEDEVYGDSGYLGAEKRGDAIIRNKAGRKIKYRINRRPSQVKKLSKSGQYAAKKAEHAKSSVRAKVEHAFGVVKKQLRFRKTRYRGLEKQRGVNPKFCVNAKLWCKIEQKCFKAGAAQAAAAFSTKITALRGNVKGGGVSLRSSRLLTFRLQPVSPACGRQKTPLTVRELCSSPAAFRSTSS